ncbi:MAG: DUF6290 family protein [Defluviitaleaceae bacterium]|nr:DUF6290 family protein [Defluviitaleaceae bacterium]
MTTLELPIGKKTLEELKAYADIEGQTVVELILDAVREKLEDLEDIRDYEIALAQGGPTRSLDEIAKELGL